MAENVGGIVWTAEMRTEQLLTAEKQATSSLDRTGKAYDRAGKSSLQSSMKMKKSAEEVGKATRGMSRNLGMAGISFQQLVGQIQGGQSAMLALSQQIPDIAFAFGAAGLGAAVGLAASALGFIIPLFSKTSNEVEDLTQSLRDLATQQQLTAEEAAILSEAEGRKVEENLRKRADLTKQLTEAEALAKRQRGAIATAGTDTEEINRYSKGLQETQANISRLKVALVVTNKEIEKGTQNIITYNNNIGDASESTQTITDRTNQLKASLQRQLITLRDGEKAGLRYAVAQQLQLKAVEKLPEPIEKLIQLIEKEEQKKKDIAAQDKKNLQAARDIAAFKAKSAKEEAARASQIQNLEQEIALAEMKRDLATEQYELEAALMALGADATDAEKARITELVGQMQQLRFEAQLTGKSIEESFRGIGLSAMNDFANATASAIVNQESLEDSIKGVAKSIITDMLAALIRYAIGSIAQAAGITAAWTPAAAAVTLGTGGANAVAATAAIGAFGSSIGAAIGSGKLNGGTVAPGTIYPVTEDGKPELLMSGGRQYLLPGTRGEVISNKDMSSSNSVSMVNNFTFNGDVNEQQARNFIFDNEDLIYNMMEQARAKRGLR